MNSKTALILIIVFVLVGTGILIIYYNQPFSEQMQFEKSVRYTDVQLQTTKDTYYTNDTYLSSATADIGSLDIKNTGSFTRRYFAPYLAGCLDLKDEIDKTSVQLNRDNIQVEYRGDGTSYSPNSYSDTPIDLSPGSSMHFKIVATYNPGNIPLNQFSKSNIKSLSVYKVDQNGNNPLSTNGYSYGYNWIDCSTVKLNQQPLSIIQIS